MWKMQRIGKVIFPKAIQGVKMAVHDRQGCCCSGFRLVLGHNLASVKLYCSLARH
jgi:hypothetical protein